MRSRPTASRGVGLLRSLYSPLWLDGSCPAGLGGYRHPRLPGSASDGRPLPADPPTQRGKPSRARPFPFLSPLGFTKQPDGHIPLLFRFFLQEINNGPLHRVPVECLWFGRLCQRVPLLRGPPSLALSRHCSRYGRRRPRRTLPASFPIANFPLSRAQEALPGNS